MFRQTIKYTLLSLSVLGLSACSQRTIVLKNGEIAQQQPTKRVYRVERPIVHEEVLIKKNPTYGSVISQPVSTTVPSVVTTPVIKAERVPVPINNPSLGVLASVNEEESLETPEHMDKIERIAFPLDEYGAIKTIGRSTVKGEIFLENSVSGQKIKGERVKLYLNPVTSYSKQWYEESYIGGYKMGKSDPRLFNYLKFTVSDENGRFNFFGIASGSYYLVGTVSCAEECGFSERKTVRLVKEVSVGRGTSNITLSKNVP